MQKNSLILIVLLALTTFSACKKGGSGAPDIRPAVTPVGTNDGTATTKTIGSGGGTVVSGDGEMELIIPPGALTANTDITIQPITNNAPNGRRKAYRCLPDGLQFAKNITVKFHYTEEDAAATKPEYMMAAFQDSEGKWQVIQQLTNDETNNTISASVNHFTDFTAFDVLRIEPAILYLEPLEQGKYEVSAAAVTQLNALLYIGIMLTHDPVWKVNGVTGGSLGTGAIARNPDGSGTYTAPGVAPTINPVSISAELNFPFVVNGQRFNQGIVTAEAHITGGNYHVLLETATPVNFGTGEKFVTKDKVNFTVNLGGIGGAVNQVENSSPTFEKIQESPVGCITTFQTFGTGYIHFNNPSKFQVVNAGGDVYVQWGLQEGHINPTALTSCPGVTPGLNEIMIGGIDIGEFSFKNNGQPQVVDKSMLDFKIKYTITPL
jgi:hypothetical protein